jgi:colanic acid biosynthesis glycosyl transferase WcaI
MSRIVFWTPNYAPELIGIAPLVTDACTWLAGRGNDVQVVTAMPNYPEREIRPPYRGRLRAHEQLDGVDVHRSWLRVRPGESVADKALYELSFSTVSAPTALRLARGSDALVCTVPSLAAAALAASTLKLLRPRPIFTLWFQDLVVPLAHSVPGPSRARRLLGAAGWSESRAARAADRVVVCSPGFRDYLLSRGVDPNRLDTILNWVDTREIAPSEPPPDGVARFVYTGNLGYTQDFATLVDAARTLVGTVEVEIVGAGNAAGQVQELAAGAPNVVVRPPVPREQLPALLASAHALLVLRRRADADANLPSKIATYLASGRPVLASVGRPSAAADLLERSGGALLVEPEAPVALAEAMMRLAGDAELRSELGSRGRQFAVDELDRTSALERLEAAILTA